MLVHWLTLNFHQGAQRVFLIEKQRSNIAVQKTVPMAHPDGEGCWSEDELLRVFQETAREVCHSEIEGDLNCSPACYLRLLWSLKLRVCEMLTHDVSHSGSCLPNTC